MDILVLTTVVLAGIALEHVIFSRARKRSEHKERITGRLAHYAGRKLN